MQDCESLSTALSKAIKQLHEGNEPKYSTIRVIEWWWGGIGNWKA